MLSQDGATTSRFVLRYRKAANGGTGGWCFGLRDSDTAVAATVDACATGAIGSTGKPAVEPVGAPRWGL